jgi:hypothetical protein
MKRTSTNLLKFADREPYEPVMELIDVPAGMLEIITLARRVEAGDTTAAEKIKQLMESIITVVLNDPESLLKLESLGQSGYRIAFLPTEKIDFPCAG